MEKFFTIFYEVEGCKRVDNIMVWSNNLTNAIKEFTNIPIETVTGFPISYTEYAIVKIECGMK